MGAPRRQGDLARVPRIQQSEEENGEMSGDACLVLALRWTPSADREQDATWAGKLAGRVKPALLASVRQSFQAGNA